jgi:hypothetical protein
MARNAIRLGDPQSMESVSYTVNRYGALQEETLNELVAWLETQKDKYNYRLLEEFGNITLVTNMIGSPIEKFIDNEKDGQNCLANIRAKI